MISSQQIFRVHKWCGLGAALLIALQAATGLMNAFRHEAGQFFDATGMTRQSETSSVSMNEVLRSLRTSNAELALERIVFPTSSSGVYFAHLLMDVGEMRYATVDPSSAALLRAGGLWTFPAEAAARIHYNLTIGLPGILAIAVVGTASLLMVVTGSLYWWLRFARLKSTLAIRWRSPWKVALRQLHRSSGIVMSALLSYSLVTGVVLAIDYSVIGLASKPSPRIGLSTTATIDLDASLRLAQEQFPEHSIRDIRFRNDSHADVFFLAPERNARAMHRVGVDLSTLTISDRASAETDDATWVTWLPLHTGESLGLFGLVLIVSNGLALFLLAVSGPVMWLGKTKWRQIHFR